MRDQMISLVRECLSDDLRKPEYAGPHPMSGHCYVAAETLYTLLGGREAGLIPKTVRHEGATHWWLETQEGEIIDPTGDQFSSSVPYAMGRGRGFLTREPSRRARVLLERVRARIADR